MNRILDYTIIEKIKETRGANLYRVKKENPEKTYIIKELKSQSPTPSEAVRFKQEYEIIKNLNLEGVIKTFDILKYDNKISLLLEDFDGTSLHETFADTPLDLQLFLKIAIKIVNTLGSLHIKNIIHKNIKPHIILYNKNTEEIKITDFGIENEITHENRELNNPDVVKGTLVYMSPEQTGRMNRQMDYRTDLYSLGVTLYELITGTIPFRSDDPMEVIYHHLAIQEKTPAECNPSIPKTISDIIMKLLSKMPEDRYQNCFGLMSDLKECLRQLEKTGTIGEFKLGRKDFSPLFIIPQVLVGRESEIVMVMDIVERVAFSGGMSEILLVSGQPGIGKSSLIHEAGKVILSKGGYFISGKYDQFRRDVPYSAIIQAFQGLVDQILVENQETIDRWRINFLETLGPNGRVITEVIPRIELITGPQPQIPELGPEQHRNRFNFVFGNFVSILASKEHPIVLFLDDLQWADNASLNLIELLITANYIPNILIIGAYRDNEADTSHAIRFTLDTIKKRGLKANFIRLDILDIVHVNRLLAYFLSCDEEKCLPLSELVYKKTGGNPFFVNQFMKTLHKENFLELDPLSGWQWDLNRVAQIQMTDNVVAFITDKIKKLPENIQGFLKICACIGNRFTLEFASHAYQKTIEETLEEIHFLVSEDIFRLRDAVYRFQHDRIHEAVYSLIPENEKEKLHYMIGTLMLEKTDEKNFQNELLYIVDQLNAGKSLIASADEHENLARLNIRAGNKAKSSAAYNSALIYYQIGIELIMHAEGTPGNEKNEEACWQRHYDLFLTLYSEACEAAYLNSTYEEMELFAEKVMKHARTLPDKVKVYEIKLYACMAQNRLVDGLATGIEALKSFGIKFPQKPGMVHIIAGLLKMNLLMKGKDIRTLLDIPMMNDPLAQGAIRILSAITSLAYFGQPNLLPLILLKLLTIIIKHGNCDVSPYVFCTYGTILITIGNINKAYEFGKIGLEMLERLHSEEKMPSTHFIMNSFIRHWKEHLKETIDPLYACIHKGFEIGDLQFAAHSIMLLCIHKHFLGTELKTLAAEITEYSPVMERIRQHTQHHMLSLQRQVVANLIEKPYEPYSLKGVFYNEDEMLPLHINANDKSAIASVYINKYTICYLFNEYHLAFEYLKKTEIHVSSLNGLFSQFQFYFYDSLLHLARYNSFNWFIRKKILLRVARNQIKLKKWTHYCPENFSNKYFLVEAEFMRIMSRSRKAVKYYNKSIASARENKFIHEEAIANECAARFWLDNNEETYAVTHLQAAYNCYLQWGAIAKIRQLEEKYSDLKGFTPAQNDKMTADGSIKTGQHTADNMEILDLSTVMKVAQIISGEIVLENLLKKIMKMAIENAGAQKGFLILENETDKKLYIEAYGAADAEITVLESHPVEKSTDLSQAIVNYVYTCKKNLLLHNAEKEGNFINDPYVKKNRSKSILCGPIVHKGKVSGIMYLENNLTANAFTQDRVELLRILSSQAAISIENATLVAHREKAAQLSIEMQIAANIQRVLLPQKPEINGYEISAYIKPADDIGGDYYDVINTGHIDWVIIGDVSGHGVSAGLVMMMVQTSIHTVLTQNPDLPPSELLTIVNKVIKNNISKLNDDKYMTITVFARQNDGQFIFSGLHQDILIYRVASRTVESISSFGMWLGLFDDLKGKVEDKTITLYPGDTMLVYTDGITEAWKKGSIRHVRNPENEMFGDVRLRDIFSRLGNQAIDEIKTEILKDLEDYECDDDVTMVFVRRLTNSA